MPPRPGGGKSAQGVDPPPAVAATIRPTSRRLIIDNGGQWIRAVIVDSDGNTSGQPFVMHNCIGSSPSLGNGLVGAALTQLSDYHSLMLRRPLDRGFLVDVGLQAHLWHYMLEAMHIADESGIDLLMTIPFGSPDQVVENIRELVFEQFSFQSLTLCSSSFLAVVGRAAGASATVEQSAATLPSATTRKRPRGDDTKVAQPPAEAPTSSAAARGTCLVVDCGFSGTTIVPYIDFRPVTESIVRTDVGGKLLTNRLKEVISFTHLNMLEDTWLVNHIKESLCSVAADFRREIRQLQAERRKGVRRYALPTIPPLMPLGCEWERLPSSVSVTKDRDRLQVLSLRQELIAVPELLFSPADGQIPQLSVASAVFEALLREGTMLQQCRFLHPALLQNIAVYGGTCRLRGFVKRLTAELVAMSTTEVSLRSCAMTESQGLLAGKDVCGTLGAESLEPLLGGVNLIRHKKLLKLVESRSRITRSEARSTTIREAGGKAKGMFLMQQCAQLLV